jgi:transposase InsO family protein
MGRDWWMSAATRGVKSYGLQQEFITPHCPDQNGLVERVIRTIKEQCVDRQRFQTLQNASRSLEKSRQPVDSSLGDLEVVGDFPDGHDGVFSAAGWHGLGQMGGRKQQHNTKFSICG